MEELDYLAFSTLDTQRGRIIIMYPVGSANLLRSSVRAVERRVFENYALPTTEALLSNGQ